MTGFGIAEMPRDVVSMNMFSQISAVHLVADTIHPCGDRSLRGRLSHDASYSVPLPRAVHPDSHGPFPLPFPAAQPAPALAGRREDIHARPDFGWCAALEMLMGPEVIVDAACVGQGPIQRPGVIDGVMEEQPFDGPDQAFDATVLPGASGIAELQTNPYVPQGRQRDCDVNTASLSVHKNRGQP